MDRHAGHWREGDLPVLVVFDAGYDVTWLAWLLADLPAVLLGHTREYTTDRPRSHGMQHRLRMQPSCR